MNDVSLEQADEKAEWVLLSLSGYILGFRNNEISKVIDSPSIHSTPGSDSLEMHIEIESELIPSYALGDNFNSVAIKHQRFAAVLNTFPAIALFSENVVNLPQHENLKLQPLPVCMQDEATPVSSLALFERSEVVLIIDADQLASRLSMTENRGAI